MDNFCVFGFNYFDSRSEKVIVNFVEGEIMLNFKEIREDKMRRSFFFFFCFGRGCLSIRGSGIIGVDF